MVNNMTPRQRLLAAITGKETDRLPITLYGTYPFSTGDWRARRGSYRPLLDLALADTDPFCFWGADAGVFYSRAEVAERPVDEPGYVERTVHTPLGPLVCVENTTPATQWTKRHMIQDEDDIRRFFSLPFEPLRPDLQAALSMEKQAGERGLCYTSFLDGLGIVAELFGPEPFALHCAWERATVRRMIARVSEQLLDYTHHLLHHGPRSIYNIGGPEYATAPLLSPAYFDEFVVAFDAPLIDLIHQHGSWAAIHCHGRLNGVLERIVDMGADVLHPCEAPPMGDVPLAEVKRRVGTRLTILGNVQIGDIVDRDEAEIDRQVLAAVTAGVPGGRFILSTTASPYEDELSPNALRNYRRLVDSGRTYGRH